MRFMTLVSLASFFALNPSAVLAKSPNPISGKIVGGVEAEKGEFPFMVSLQRTYGSRPFCGGSLIASNWVLTAAHCSGSSMVQNTRVKIGHHTVKDTVGVESHAIKRVIIHPQYNGGTIDYDYALLELATPSEYTPVKLQQVEVEIPSDGEGAPVSTVIGFGATSEGGPQSDVMLKVDKPLVSFDQCNEAYEGEITEQMICAGFPEGGKDSCQGDSGGPLILRDAANEPVLTGVVSWGHGCARPEKYGVYSKVSAAVQWIAESIESSRK
jgi:trypsin